MSPRRGRRREIPGENPGENPGGLALDPSPREVRRRRRRLEDNRLIAPAKRKYQPQDTKNLEVHKLILKFKLRLS